MDLADVITDELGIPKSYIKNYKSSKNRTFVIVPSDWMASLLTCNKIPEFISSDNLTGDEIQTLFFEKEQPGNWHRILINAVAKLQQDELIIPLPRVRAIHSGNEVDLSFAQLLHYISETNFKNMWKYFYKKHIGDKSDFKGRDSIRGNSMNKNNEILVEIIKRFYGCRIIQGKKLGSGFTSQHAQTEFEPHTNILPALCAIESKNWFLILHYMNQNVTLKDCVTFSPTLIHNNCTKPLFLIYQILQVMKNSHDKGLILGNIQLDDIFIDDTLFIQVIPNLEDNICKLSDIDCDPSVNLSNDQTKTIEFLPKYSTNKLFTVVPSFPRDSDLEGICSKWVNKEISNFDYLMYLNHMAGRRFGDPSCHFIMPWVSDFSTRANGTWRDLSKSKFRLNKGDRQLDLTYENAQNSSQIPHHVSDVLSEITYYVYLSRRTARSILCKHVRSVWVPAEYPSSVQRLQEWTPDECIPEFFYDPTIFKSIHEDLPDLELPHWALTPEEFIEAHRECLESKYVSDRLHNWIDLTFGYKLSGSAAVKSKNVCLHLVENHRQLKTSGVVQLFNHPHPSKRSKVQFYEKIPPKILLSSSVRQTKVSATPTDRGTGGSDDEGHSSGNGEDDTFNIKSSPLIFSKFLSRSKGSLLAPFQSSSSEDTCRSEFQKGYSGTQPSNSSVTINIPRDFNPSGFMAAVETNQNFFRKTFPTKTDVSPSREKKCKSNLKQVVANKRIQEMQVLGCLVVEIFLNSRTRVIDQSDLEKRLKACLNFTSHDSLPPYVRSAVALLLHPFNDPEHYSYVTSSGLPPPSAHQLLQPLLSSFFFPFPKLFPVVYSSVSNLIACTKAIAKHELWNPHEHQVRDALQILKVKRFKADLERVWDDSWFSKSNQIIDLVFPFVKELFDNPSTSRLSVILFLDKVCRSLGPKQTNELLLETLIKLYNSNSLEPNENLYLYHKKFLLILIVRCGLKVFLENFIGPLIEVVGRYHDNSDEKWDADLSSEEHEGDIDQVVTNVEVESSPELQHVKKVRTDLEIEVFSFEQDEGTTNQLREEIVRQAVEHLDLNLTEDQLDDEIAITPGVSRLQSPEIAIPGVQARRHTSPEEEDGKNWDPSTRIFENFNFDRDCLDISQIKASDVAGDSIIWLAHRLGPVLTSRHLTRNLLRVLSLCFTGKDNLEACKLRTDTDEAKLSKLSVLKWKVVGDENVETVLRVLGEISELYGEQIILLQYIPFMSELINLSKKFTLSLEGGVIGCLTLLKYIVPFMNDATLMDELQDVILKTIIHPVIRLVSSTRFVFPSGYAGRYALVAKLVDCIYLISLRIGAEMTKVHIAVPALQRFFLIFDKAHGVLSNYKVGLIDREAHSEYLPSPLRSTVDNRYLEIQRDGSTTEWSVRDTPGEPVSFAHVCSQDSLDSLHCESTNDQLNQNTLRSDALTELKNVFDARLAHQCYGTFYRFLGDTAMENCLKNQTLLRDLYYRYEQEQSSQGSTDSSQRVGKDRYGSQDSTAEGEGIGSFGSNVAVIGNKIELQTCGSADSLACINGVMDADVSSQICREKKDSGRQLRGNWLAYWEHEIGRSEKDSKFNFKQIKLQNFTGHGNSVRMICCLENENSFLSGSKDKTVKLWSLRSQGDGHGSNGCQFTYAHHRKSLLSLSFIPSTRIVASCDSTIHLWDPFVGKTISAMDNTRVAPINCLKALNPPSCCLVAATMDATLKIVDARLSSFVSEFKVSLNSVGLIRSICVSSNGYWIAVGQASGQLTVLDIRTGTILSSWKGHEAEVLQLAVFNDNVLMSSSLDQTVSAWSPLDGKFKFCMKGPTEPVHCLAVYNSELITGTTANRIGVHTSIDNQASFSSTKLRSDTFKGILTSMAVLPLNKLLLLGADNGNITLLC